ncbi:hypothetical protein [Halomarina litorea]|uniref:hypothetical protein n=1 Tax=Halomarina litorea TaxID=2961595 RepID=UPI0020C53B12|nr:hypothetical protein [Halomarina sp. BCD28]
MNTRRHLVATCGGAVLCGLAGCLGVLGDDSGTPTPRVETIVEEVSVENEGDSPRTVRFTLSRDGETVLYEAVTVPAMSGRRLGVRQVQVPKAHRVPGAWSISVVDEKTGEESEVALDAEYKTGGERSAIVVLVDGDETAGFYIVEPFD